MQFEIIKFKYSSVFIAIGTITVDGVKHNHIAPAQASREQAINTFINYLSLYIK